MIEVVASLEVALALQENKDSALLDEDIFDMGETLEPLSHSPPTGPNKGIKKPSLGEDTLGEDMTSSSLSSYYFGIFGSPFETPSTSPPVPITPSTSQQPQQQGLNLTATNDLSIVAIGLIACSSIHHQFKITHGLETLINQAIPLDTEIPGYRAPKVTNTGKVSQASDMYSYGILLLELLIGESPAYSTGRDENYDLVQWVNSVIRKEYGLQESLI
ncbi:hypothetical protein LguiA_002237 [Lonicera macranthoides]